MREAPPNLAELRLGEPLGSGAVATVVRVHAGDGRQFAGKILHTSHRQDAAAQSRFAQEAELLRGVHDPHIVEVFGVVEVEGERVLLLELVEGPTLAELIAREAPLGEARLAGLGAGIARGLARAHAAGVVHRDLKPANILVAGGHTPKIGDFGMARATSLAGVDRSALTVLGTPDYMAPECLDPLAVDVRSDLYALGCILFEMATGGPPFAGATAFGVIEAHRRAPVPVLPDSFSPPLRSLVQSLLAKAPGDRPQAAAQVAALLEQLASGSTAALAVFTDERAGGDPPCAGCGQPRPAALAVCLHCGLPAARAEPGPFTVLVAGPGEPGDQLDVTLREALRRWVAGNPGLLVTPGLLDKKLPRVPFTLLRGVSEATARTVGEALRQLGVEVEVVRGGPLKSAKMRKKARALVGRSLAVALASSAGVMSSKAIFVLAPLLLVGVTAAAMWSSVRQMTRRGEQPAALPAPLQQALAEVERVGPTIDEARHRHSLRAVVGRALALAPALEPAAGPDPDAPAAELAQAVTAATAAAARLDALDRELAARGIHGGDEAVRATLHERDTWAARLLSLTASLDGLAARVARARAGAGEGEAAALADLRARVDALEEVQRGGRGT
ncbi:serine/threonine-protein kinase [Nannocystis pusilla]|uniref:mitogen-activated protein kinase kinase n=1 Tax=Nannocystis pusilla TaxID=889268 RepID=A0ABS7TNS9_9BACT|nr:serine/threonine-protein kinase [Nannocystis pusilla]MBZ5709881.1 serine/threonine protein kinase [Nannocystis pusilla]